MESLFLCVQMCILGPEFISIIFKAEKKTWLPLAVHDYAWHFYSTYSEKAGGQKNWQAGEWIMEKSLSHLDTNYQTINNWNKSIDARNYWQMQREHYQKANALSVTSTLTGDTSKRSGSFQRGRCNHQDTAWFFMMGPLSSSHMPEKPLSLLPRFIFSLISFHRLLLLY